MANASGMIFTFVPNTENVFGKMKTIMFSMKGPTSYQQGGGIQIPKELARMKVVVGADYISSNQAGNARYLVFDQTIGGFRAIVATTGVEVANGIDISSGTYIVQIFGY